MVLNEPQLRYFSGSLFDASSGQPSIRLGFTGITRTGSGREGIGALQYAGCAVDLAEKLAMHLIQCLPLHYERSGPCTRHVYVGTCVLIENKIWTGFGRSPAFRPSMYELQ